MISMLTFSNADEILHIADTYTLDRVKHFYTNKVLTNFDEFSRTEQFLQLPAKQLARQVRLLCVLRPCVHDHILFSFIEIQQDSTPVGCVPPACQPYYVFWWQPLDVSVEG